MEWVLVPNERVSHRARGGYQPRRTVPGCHSRPSPWCCGMQAQTCTLYTKTAINISSRRHNEPRTLLSQIARRSFRVGYIKLHKHVRLSSTIPPSGWESCHTFQLGTCLYMISVSSGQFIPRQGGSSYGLAHQVVWLRAFTMHDVDDTRGLLHVGSPT